MVKGQGLSVPGERKGLDLFLDEGSLWLPRFFVAIAFLAWLILTLLFLVFAPFFVALIFALLARSLRIGVLIRIFHKYLSFDVIKVKCRLHKAT
jgi:hypothetical protein